MLSGNTIFPQLLLQEKGEGEGNSWECKFCASAGAQTVPRPGSQATEDSRVSVHTFSRKPESWPQQNKLVGGDRQPSSKEQEWQEERMERRAEL